MGALGGDADLLGRVALAQGDGAVLERLPVDRQAERRADLVLTAAGPGPYVRDSRTTNDLLKPQDVLVLLKLASSPGEPWTYAALAASVGLSASEAHASLGRAAESGLLSASTRQPVARRLLEFVVHGVPYAYPAARGVPTARGVLTGFAAPPLDGPERYSADLTHVWPEVDGLHSGRSVAPLYRSAPFAALRDPALYELLALVDEVRLGRARERNRAVDLLSVRLGSQ